MHIFTFTDTDFSLIPVADMPIFTDILLFYRSEEKEQNHLKFMCVYNINSNNLIACVGGRFYNVFYQCATNPLHGNESQVVIKHLSQLLKWSFGGIPDPFQIVIG